MASNIQDKLSIASYNCEYADGSWVDFLKEVFKSCDFLLIQEHRLYKSQFGWFNRLNDDGIGKHGVSAMNEHKLLSGRPHGGAAILWHNNI